MGTFVPGRRVVIHQSQGSGAGLYERNTISNVEGTTVTLASALGRAYTTGAQMVAVLDYDVLTVTASGAITGPAWDGTSGGILAMDANTVSLDGSISMTGLGFRGRNHPCVYHCRRGYQGESSSGIGSENIDANGSGGGGGGAGQDDACGAGGSYGTAGTAGGNGTCGVCAEACPIPGGSAGPVVGTPNLVTTVLMGSAGGEGGADEDGGNPGTGGNGGGIIMISTGTLAISSTGSITSDGLTGANGASSACGGVGCGMGGGGGGSGGAVRVVALTSAAVGSSRITALGGGGGIPTCGTVRGGIGGLGRIGINTPAFTGTTNPPRDTN
jgi:hypothetical protein